jgi:transketolase
MGMDTFGASGKGNEVTAYFGFTASNVRRVVADLVWKK